MAAGVGHPLGLDNGLPVLGGELREAVIPAGGRAVGGGGVDDPGVGVVDHGHRLPGGVIRQAEENQVGGVEALFPLRRVLALFLVDEQQLNVLPGGQAVVNLQAGGAFPAVDEYHRFHASRSWTKDFRLAIWTFTASGAGPP